MDNIISSFNARSDGFRFEALVPEKEGDKYQRLRAGLDRIDYIYSVDENISCIRMKSGVVIPVALSLDALDEKLGDTDFKRNKDRLINLTSWTGEAVKDLQAPSLRDEFKASTAATSRGIIIRAFVHFEDFDADFTEADIDDTHISKYVPHQTRSGETKIYIKKEHRVGKDVYYVLPVAAKTFQEELENARYAKTGILDLREQTRPKTFTSMKNDRLVI